MSERAESVRSESRPLARPRLRIVNGLLFGAFAALGFGLTARPALLFGKSLGLFAPVLPWDVPLGRLFLALALGLCVETLRLFLALTSGSRLRARDRVPLLLLILAALAARATAGEPLPPASATARLVSALRATAEALDLAYAKDGRYAPDPAALDARLAALGSSLFVYRGHDLALRALVVERPSGAQIDAREGDLPGAVYLAPSADRTRVFLSALTLDGAGKPDILRAPGGRPLFIEARFGTHSAPGRDPLVPEYPGMQSLGQGKHEAPR